MPGTPVTLIVEITVAKSGIGTGAALLKTGGVVEVAGAFNVIKPPEQIVALVGATLVIGPETTVTLTTSVVTPAQAPVFVVVTVY